MLGVIAIMRINLLDLQYRRRDPCVRFGILIYHVVYQDAGIGLLFPCLEAANRLTSMTTR